MKYKTANWIAGLSLVLAVLCWCFVTFDIKIAFTADSQWVMAIATVLMALFAFFSWRTSRFQLEVQAAQYDMGLFRERYELYTDLKENLVIVSKFVQKCALDYELEKANNEISFLLDEAHFLYGKEFSTEMNNIKTLTEEFSINSYKNKEYM